MQIPRWMSRYPLTFLGILSTSVLIASAAEIVPLKGIWGVIMLPAYVVHLALVFITVIMWDQSPSWLWAVAMPFRIAPFVALDHLIGRFGRREPARFT